MRTLMNPWQIILIAGGKQVGDSVPTFNSGANFTGESCEVA